MFQTAFQKSAFQVDAFQILFHPVGGDDGGDWTKEERKRHKALQKKLRIAEEKRIEALKADAISRKKTIADLVDPKPSKRNKTKVESKQEVSVDNSQLVAIDRYIENLQKQQYNLQVAVSMRNAKIRLEQELAILEAKKQSELDDEEALLALIL